MNYRHAFHAGNFADVVKHAVLARVIEHMKLKDAPFRVIDTHAGAGLYALDGPEAAKTGEWQGGIGRLIGADRAPLTTPVRTLLAPYLDAVAAENGGAALVRYPGSPWLARRLLRPQDRLVVNELHEADHAGLAALFARDKQTKVLALDGWTTLKALLPPRERRAVVLVDPPFEQAGEFERLADGLAEARRRFATGTLLLWYPIKDRPAVQRFQRALSAMAIPKLLAADLFVRSPRDNDMLNGAGLVILNPPFTLPAELEILLPALARLLAQGPGSGHALQWLAGA